MPSVYIHIPFCLKKCGYCDFHSVVFSDIPKKEYAAAVCRELDVVAEKCRERSVDTIYFGGGTPMLLGAENLETILTAIREKFSVSDDAEITIESNPETLSNIETLKRSNIETLSNPETLKRSNIETLKRSNIETLKRRFNRFSIGIQTFNDRHLKKLGRIHSAEAARNAVKLAQKVGIENVSIDLMWGLPEQTMGELEYDLNEALKLNVQHISCYQLSLQGYSADEDLSREMFLAIHDTLVSHGFEHYEISNFSKKRCRHNENYWHYGDWLGLGSGATSFLNGNRWNVETMKHCNTETLKHCNTETLKHCNTETLKHCNTETLIKRYISGDFVYNFEQIPPKTAMAEFCFLGLRTSDGIDLDRFEHRFGKNFEDVYPDVCEKWQRDGVATRTGSRLALTIDGWLISDELFQKFV